MPFEGSTLQCDARKTPQCDVGQSEAPEGVCPLCHLPPISPFTDPSALRAPSPSPDVRLGSLTLMRHKMTFSHFSKGFIRPNLGEESGVWLTFRFQVSSSHPLCPSESGGRGATLRRGYDKRKCGNGNVKGAVSLQTVIAICTLSPVLCPNRKDLKRL